MKIIFPLMMAMGLEASTTGWVHIIGRDPAALHISAFAIETFVDKILRHKDDGTNPVALLHFNRGLGLLRERLIGEDAEARISNSTIGVVLKLASTAHVNGDYQVAKQHMAGLRKMVVMRGGQDAFRGTYFQMEMFRSVALLLAVYQPPNTNCPKVRPEHSPS